MGLKSAADSVGDTNQTNLSLPKFPVVKWGQQEHWHLGFFLACFVSFVGSPRESNHLLLAISTAANSVVTSSAWSQLDPVAVSLID